MVELRLCEVKKSSRWWRGASRGVRRVPGDAKTRDLIGPRLVISQAQDMTTGYCAGSFV